MAQNQRPQSIAELARNAQIEAVLEQMYGYFSREAPRRVTWTELAAQRPC